LDAFKRTGGEPREMETSGPTIISARKKLGAIDGHEKQ